MPQGSAEDQASAALSRRNSLGLGRKELLRLLDELDSTGPDAHGKREYSRWPYRVLYIDVRLEHPGGSDIGVRLACRNISSGGAGLLHNSFVHPGTRCSLQLPHETKRTVRVQGTVVRCEHLRGVIHQLGVKFDEHIDPRSFVPKENAIGRFTRERVDASSLQGTLLHVDPTEMDQQIMKHFLRDTKLRVRSADNGVEGIAFAKEGVDIILAERVLPDMTGVEFAAKLRSEGVGAAVILVSTEPAPQTVSEQEQRLIASYLLKPLSQLTMFQAIDDFIRTAKIDNEADKAHAMQEVDPEILQMFHDQIAVLSDRIVGACEDNVTQDVYKACLQIKGSAPALGLVDLGQLAALVTSHLGEHDTLEPIKDQVAELVNLCREIVGESPVEEEVPVEEE